MKLLKEVKDLETPNKTETIGKKPERPFAKMSKEDQGVANPVYADAVRNLEKTDELRKKGLNIDKAPEHKEKPDKIKLQPAHKKMHLSENLFEDITTQRVLKEEVSDEAYEIAERIDNNFAGEEFITRDDFDNEFNSIAEELFQGGIDWENGTLPNGDDIYDLIADVRGILAMKGWETIYEGENEGGLDRTDEESVSPNKLIYNALHEYENSHYDTLTRSEQNVFNKLINYYYNHLEDVVDKSIYEESLKKNEKSKTFDEDDDLEEALSQEETRELDKLNADNHWSFDYDQLMELVAQHKEARERNDEHTMERIEYRLTDCNFHTLCELLMDAKYEEARKYIDTDLYESLTEKKVKENDIFTKVYDTLANQGYTLNAPMHNAARVDQNTRKDLAQPRYDFTKAIKVAEKFGLRYRLFDKSEVDKPHLVIYFEEN